MLIIQISRGVAPVICIIEAMEAARMYARPYHAILQRPLVEAKNDAIELARNKRDNVVLMEDDILVPRPLWAHVLDEEWPANTVGYGFCRMREGGDNIIRNNEGAFLSTGNVFSVIAYDVIEQLEPPVFEAYWPQWLSDSSDNRFSNPNTKGLGSDGYFWYKLRHLPNPPNIVELGRVRHIRHPLNEQQDNIHPCELSEW